MKTLILILLISVSIMAQDRIVIDNVSHKITVNFDQPKEIDSLSLEYFSSLELSGDKEIERVIIDETENKVTYEYAENGFHGYLVELTYLTSKEREYLDKRKE